jgi:hypothetical protein
VLTDGALYAAYKSDRRRVVCGLQERQTARCMRLTRATDGALCAAYKSDRRRGAHLELALEGEVYHFYAGSLVAGLHDLRIFEKLQNLRVCMCGSRYEPVHVHKYSSIK